MLLCIVLRSERLRKNLSNVRIGYRIEVSGASWTEIVRIIAGYQVRDIALAMKIGARGQFWQKMTLECNNHHRLIWSCTLYIFLLILPMIMHHY